MEFRPSQMPLGLALARSAAAARRAFDDALAQAGGSLPVWLILLNVKIQGAPKQRDLATAIGLTEATLSHHLSGLERDGLVSRRRDPENRRVQLVELTDQGEARFLALRHVALAFDARLRKGFSEADSRALGELLERLVNNVAAPAAGALPWTGLIE